MVEQLCKKVEFLLVFIDELLKMAEDIQEKIKTPEYPKSKIWICHAGKYLYSIYTVFKTIHRAFTVY